MTEIHYDEAAAKKLRESLAEVLTIFRAAGPHMSITVLTQITAAVCCMMADHAGRPDVEVRRHLIKLIAFEMERCRAADRNRPRH